MKTNHHSVLRSMLLALGVGAVLSASVPATLAEPPTLCETVLAFAGEAREALDVPGFAVALVSKDQVLCIEGLGYRDLEGEKQVTPATGFYLGSVSKSFLGLAASLLAAEGSLDLDAPITRYLPELAFPEPILADEITVLDLLTHVSGLQNRDVQRHLPFVGRLERPELMKRLAESTTSSGTGFRYTNLGYYLVGEIVESVTGKSWQEVVRRRVLEPAGMSGTTSKMSVAAEGEFAWPYAVSGPAPERLDVKTDGQMHAAGGHVSTAVDLARWVRLHLGRGRLDSQRVFPEPVIREMQRPQAEVDTSFLSFGRTGYGLGMYTGEMEGTTVLHHFGGFIGYQAHTSFAPDLGLGVVALANTVDNGRGELPHLVARLAYRLAAGDDGAVAELRERARVAGREARGRDSVQQRLAAIRGLWESERFAEAADELAAALDGHRAILGEGRLNDLGYRFLQQDQTPLALIVFRRNIERHPDSANPWDSLGEALERAGDLEGAAAAYQKAVARAAGSEDRELFEGNLNRVNAALAAPPDERASS